MAEVFSEFDTEMIEAPDVSHIITEDDEPVDNIFSEKQQRLLTETLNSNWNPEKPFAAFSNVGVFYAIHKPPVVPDMFLSLDVKIAEDIWDKKNRTYLIWEFGKPPEVVVEIVSNKKGGESDEKLKKYEQIRVSYYIIYDPEKLIQKDDLRIYKSSEGKLIPKIDHFLQQVGLGITLWEGEYEGYQAKWLRWLDEDGNLVPTGAERADKETERADKERERAEKLAAMLRAAGIDPDIDPQTQKS